MTGALAHRRFLKMNGLGNEILVMDLRGTAHEISNAQAAAIAAMPRAHFDQLMVLHDPITVQTDAYLRIYNTDGSRSAACGNGTRCVAWAMLADPAMGGSVGSILHLETEAGILVAERVSDFVFSVDMGAPRLGWDEIPLRDAAPDTRAIPFDFPPLPPGPSAVNMGNPHVIYFVPDPQAYDLVVIGPAIERHPAFPEGVNVSLAETRADDHLILRVWERGAGLTLACGSAACAALVAGARKGLTGRQATVTLPGGDLAIAWREEDDHVVMTGPVALEWEGVLPAELALGAA